MSGSYKFKELNDKHRMFCEEYIKCNYRRQEAYINVYKTKNKATRSNNAKKLLDHPLILEELDRIKEEKLKRDKTELDKWKFKREKVLNSMVKIVDSKTSQDKDKISARRVFLSMVDKHEQITEKEEKELKGIAKNSFKVLTRMYENEDLTKYENIEEEGEK